MRPKPAIDPGRADRSRRRPSRWCRPQCRHSAAPRKLAIAWADSFGVCSFDSGNDGFGTGLALLWGDAAAVTGLVDDAVKRHAAISVFEIDRIGIIGGADRTPCDQHDARASLVIVPRHEIGFPAIDAGDVVFERLRAGLNLLLGGRGHDAGLMAT